MKKLILIIAITFHTSLFTLHSFSQNPCLPEGITFTTQAQIDSFQVNYPNCTEIEGDVVIRGDNIINLNGLNSITAFKADLCIGEPDYWFPSSGNPNLSNLSGLSQVTSIGGYLFINRNNLLVDLEGLDSLVTIGGNLTIGGNDSLSSLEGFNHLSFIGGDVTIGYSSWGFGVDNPSLNSLIGLSNLDSIGGSLGIANSPNLTNLAGLEGLHSIPGTLNIGGNYGAYNLSLINLSGLDNITSIGTMHIGYNPGLKNLTGLNNLTTIIENAAFFNNDSLVSLSGLENLTSIGHVLDFRWNPSLINADGLNNLESIGGNFSVYKNNALEDFSGLESLVSINGSLIIGDDGGSYGGNPSLTSLNGLNNLSSIGLDLIIRKNGLLTNVDALQGLTSIGGHLSIGGYQYNSGNPMLTSVSGLENIDAGSISGLTILNNNTLSSCDVQSICDYLSDPNGIVEISNNAPGCNSQQEVQDDCDSITSVSEMKLEESFTISPNPSSGETHLRYTIYDVGYVMLDLYEISGVKVRSILNEEKVPGTYEMEVDLSDLPEGIYFCVLKTDNGIQTKKIIKL